MSSSVLTNSVGLMQRSCFAATCSGSNAAAALLRVPLDLGQMFGPPGEWRQPWYNTSGFRTYSDITSSDSASSDSTPKFERRPFEFDKHDRSTPYDFRVSAQSRPGAAAGFLLRALRENVPIRATASGIATYNMIRACGIANDMMKESSDEANKRIALQPVLQRRDNFQKVNYIINFQPHLINWSEDILAHKDLRMSLKSPSLAFRLAIVRNMLDEGLACVSGAGPKVCSRALINTTEVCMRLGEIMPDNFQTLIIPSLKQEENGNGSMLHLFKLLVLRGVADKSPEPQGVLVPPRVILHPKPLTDAEVSAVAPQPDMNRVMFSEFVASTARWFADEPGSKPSSAVSEAATSTETATEGQV